MRKPFGSPSLLLLLSSCVAFETSVKHNTPLHYRQAVRWNKIHQRVSSRQPNKEIIYEGPPTDGVLSLSPQAIQIAENLAPKLGVFTSSALYFAPTAAVFRAVRNNDIGDLNPLPPAFMSIVTVGWVVYGLAIQDPYVVLSYLPGAIGSIGFVFGILPLLRDDIPMLRRTQGVLVTGCVSCLSLWSYLGISGASASKIGSALGLFASGVVLILAASPLTTVGKVLDKKCSRSILGPLTIAQVINTSVWSAYGLAINNRFVYVPKMIALSLGLAQLALKVKYPSRGKTIKQDAKVDLSHPPSTKSSRKSLILLSQKEATHSIISGIGIRNKVVYRKMKNAL